MEDDEEVRFLCAETLRKRGFFIIECPTLAVAREVLAQTTPELLLVDRDLPDGCGLDLTRELRARQAHAGLRIVAFSGRSSPDEIEEAFVAGCDAFVAKPCSSQALGAQIERLLADEDCEPPAESQIRQVGSQTRAHEEIGAAGVRPRRRRD